MVLKGPREETQFSIGLKERVKWKCEAELRGSDQSYMMTSINFFKRIGTFATAVEPEKVACRAWLKVG